jgi:hypothetical protein
VDAARAYLDINCAHCHNDKGAANTTALHLNMGAPADLHLGLCKPPVAAGAGTGGRSHDIAPGKPDDSIMLYRLNSAEPGVMMPELGRGSVHRRRGPDPRMDRRHAARLRQQVAKLAAPSSSPSSLPRAAAAFMPATTAASRRGFHAGQAAIGGAALEVTRSRSTAPARSIAAPVAPRR